MRRILGLKLLAIRVRSAVERMHAPKWISVTLITVTLVCALVLAWLVYQTSIAKEAELWGKAFLFIIGALAAAATALVSWQPGEQSVSERIVSPFGAGITLVAVFGAFGAMTDALSLFEPRAATTEDIQPIIANTDETLEIVRELRGGIDKSALSRIGGRWGETRDCNIAYDVMVEESVVTFTRVAGPQIPDFKMVGSVKGQDEVRVTLSVELPTNAYGQSLDIVHSGNGPAERLSWIEAGRDVSQDYFRCSLDQ